MSRLRAADGGGAAAKRAKLPLIRCKGLEGVKVAGSVFIEKLTDSELICFSEANGYRLPSGTKLGKVKETHTGLIFFSLPLSFFTSPPHYDEFLCRFVNIITVRPSSYVISFSFFLFFYNLNSYQQLSHRPTWLSLLLSMLCIHPLSCQAKQPAPSRSIAAIKHGRKPVSVLLKQFSMAQGHSSNISFSCLPVQQRPGASCSWGEIVPILTSDPFDWLLYLGAERIGAGLTDWCLDAADDFVRVHRLALIPTLPPLSVWLTGTDAFWLEERKKKGKGKKTVWVVSGENIAQ